jgi:hypothetical protein
MPNLIASLSNNTLKLSVNVKTSPKNNFKAVTAEISKDIVHGSEILDTQAFSSEFVAVLSQLPNIKKQETDLIFLVEPSDVILKFVTISKNSEASVEDQIIEGIQEKLENTPLDDLYYSYEKIAPFVYQFTGVKKENLDKYLEIANFAGLSLKAVVPWVLALPKFLDSNDPCVFVFNTDNRQAVALSELNGIYFCESFEKNRSLDQIRTLVYNLSIYKRQTPINKVYTLTSEQFGLSSDYDVEPLLDLAEDFAEAKGYEIHLLAEEVLLNNPDYFLTQLNLLNLLPVPVAVNKNNSKVYAGAFVGAFVLVLLGFGIYRGAALGSNNNLAVDRGNIPDVLSDQNNPKPVDTDVQDEE